MGSPSSFKFIRQTVSFGLVAVFACSLALPTHAREPAPQTLLDTFLAIDSRISDAAQVAAARPVFEALVHEASRCDTVAIPVQDRARCVVDVFFAAGECEPLAEPRDPESSTMTSALVSRRGNCAGLTALVLAVAERVGVPMEAVVFHRHVVVRAPGDSDHVFELLSRGARLSIAQLRTQLGAEGARDTRVRSKAFPAFYLDNLAVRFGDTGDGDRAQAMFEKAIEAAPRVSRIRSNYGTFLLGRDTLKLAESQL
jgi:regulator of sirC expression with transglutaminase-like and TPR domain